MGSQTYMFALILYFIGITVVWSLMQPALSGEVVLDTQGYVLSQSGNNITGEDVADVSVFKIGKFFGHIFSLYGWNLTVDESSAIYPYLLYIKLLFVWLPGLFLILTIVYSLPFMSG